jgi:hypothetical protein
VHRAIVVHRQRRGSQRLRCDLTSEEAGWPLGRCVGRVAVRADLGEVEQVGERAQLNVPSVPSARPASVVAASRVGRECFDRLTVFENTPEIGATS